jgi:shikimate dehydrogenase
MGPPTGEVWFPNSWPGRLGSQRADPFMTSPGTIGASTGLVGLLGDPVHHSLSPAMHNAALQAMGLDWVFLALPTPADQLGTVTQGLEAIGCRGLNVTIPHKQTVAGLCRELSPLAQRVGAVNVLVPHADGGWFGTNTDVEGFYSPLQEAESDWSERRALVLGCGGSARAVVAGLTELGCTRIQIAGRRQTVLEDVMAACGSWSPQLETLLWSDDEILNDALEHSDVVVNTTPVGMASPSKPEAAEASPLSTHQIDRLKPGSWMVDIIYTPRPTRLLQLAAAQGCQTLDGLEMLVRQGAAALRLWSGRQDVPVGIMREAALAQLTPQA